MKNLFQIVLVAVCVLLRVNSLDAFVQKPDNDTYTLQPFDQPSDVPYFDVKMVNTASEFENLSRLNIQLKLVNDELQFITTKDKVFRADYEVKAVFFKEDGTRVDSVRWTDFAIAPNFDATKSTRITQFTSNSIDLPPAKYGFRIGLKDMETRRVSYREGTAKLRDFSASELAISDIWLIDSAAKTASIEEDSSVQKQKPSLIASFEIYHANSDSVRLSYEILDQRNQVIQNGAQRLANPDNTIRHQIAISKGSQVSQPQQMKLVIQDNGRSLEVDEPLQWGGSREPVKIADLEDAIEKLIYIAKDKELDELKEAEGEEQLTLFKEFWKKRDPTPNTEVNEYLQEYYLRINRANELFKDQSMDSAWRTDMGKVYVMLGPPDDIRRAGNYRNQYVDPFFRRYSTIVWDYFQLNRRVIFEYRGTNYRLANHHEVFDLLNGEMYF
ncbi:GWxTD domain-containing protein [candidate division KSB1 bacterium]|nr:GWxTD domain-containing protein [candidate division KSB1 bacterium]NIR72150.1 GWxTD domain-containing protein [candidate division KSB1 bacterium]NIS26615.1 GWxTD domain-containing protein [candidate division KSB1 bacterium]NIT73383.1 GWxTD domain-containing protein [candidate division KSB1 bacterium]NIU27231.1 GWxTD domain-containing protein [candidate division KSB1 bacterium]